MMMYEIFVRTEVGCTRERNEDSFLVLDLATGARGLWPACRTGKASPPGSVVAVCDGMGGAAAGDVAARIALEELERVVRSRGPLQNHAEVEACLLEGITAGNRAIHQYTNRHPQKRGMGTTMTTVGIIAPELVIAHVGDSRAYLRRGKRLVQLTTDQSVVGQMIAKGELRPEQARNAGVANALLEAIGVQDRVGPELVRTCVQPGDVLLLCTDGLTAPLSDDQILEVMLGTDSDPLRCCRALTEAACAAGGPDNITVAVLRWASESSATVDEHTRVDVQRRTAIA
jgi:protein phosphatase